MTAPQGAAIPRAPAVRLRPMNGRDVGPVATLEKQLFGAEAWSAAMLTAELAQPLSRYYVVAEVGAAAVEWIVGYGGIMVVADEASIQTIGVSAARQRAGVGAALLEDLVAAADRRGAGTVFLEVAVDNEAAQRLYARFGFSAVGRRRGYYQAGTDALIMRRGGAL